MRRLNEARTRKELIDPELEKAGWNLRDHSKIQIEIPVDDYNAEPWNGVTDYCLYRENGEVLAVVEAKKTTHDPRLAEAQAEHYISEIVKHQSFKPFIFLANGIDIYFIDSGISAKRLLYGFYTREDLERILWLRQNQKTPSSINPTERVKIIGNFPPRKIQDEYSTILQKHLILKRRLQESEYQIELLFKSLLQQAFQGEL